MAKESTHKVEKGSFEVKVGLAEMLKGGVIMDVTNPEQAKIAEDAGAVAVVTCTKTSNHSDFSCGSRRSTQLGYRVLLRQTKIV